jgi:hypothetical protein
VLVPSPSVRTLFWSTLCGFRRVSGTVFMWFRRLFGTVFIWFRRLFGTLLLWFWRLLGTVLTTEVQGLMSPHPPCQCEKSVSPHAKNPRRYILTKYEQRFSCSGFLRRQAGNPLLWGLFNMHLLTAAQSVSTECMHLVHAAMQRFGEYTGCVSCTLTMYTTPPFKRKR